MALSQPKQPAKQESIASQRVGILALQGDISPHYQALAKLGVVAAPIRTAQELTNLSALVIPGGESTTMSVLMKRWNLYEPLREKISQGLAVLGTCAGAILLANRIKDKQNNVVVEPVGGMDFVAVRNAWGRQVDSFEAPVKLRLSDNEEKVSITGVFIRAPRFQDIGPKVQIIGELEDGEPVVLRQGKLIACSFHPELTAAPHLHRLLLRLASGELD